MIPGDATMFENNDNIFKTMDHMAYTDLLYPPEFLHKVLSSGKNKVHKGMINCPVGLRIIRSEESRSRKYVDYKYAYQHKSLQVYRGITDNNFRLDSSSCIGHVRLRTTAEYT